MSRLTTADWRRVTAEVPIGLSKKLRQRLIEDDMSIQQFVMTMAHAYVSGQISLHRNPILKDLRGPSLASTGEIDEYRAIIKDGSNTIINPAPMQNDIL